MAHDYAVAPSQGNSPAVLVLHRADCHIARSQAALGEPVLTLFGCEGDPDPKMARCSCLGVDR